MYAYEPGLPEGHSGGAGRGSNVVDMPDEQDLGVLLVRSSRAASLTA